jgi:hypothetical protein
MAACSTSSGSGFTPSSFGRGGPEALLYEDSPTTMLTFVDAKPLKSGTVILSYRFDAAGDGAGS